MDVGRLGDMMGFFAIILVMRLGCTQAWRYKRTFLCSFNLKLNQDHFELPS